MHEFWYDYVKPKGIKRDYIYNDIAKDVEIRFHTSNYELEYSSIDRPLPEGKN